VRLEMRLCSSLPNVVGRTRKIVKTATELCFLSLSCGEKPVLQCHPQSCNMFFASWLGCFLRIEPWVSNVLQDDVLCRSILSASRRRLFRAYSSTIASEKMGMSVRMRHRTPQFFYSTNDDVQFSTWYREKLLCMSGTVGQRLPVVLAYMCVVCQRKSKLHHGHIHNFSTANTGIR
jgi:hypothetical protein